MTIRDVRGGLDGFKADVLDPQPRVGFGIPFLDQATGGGLRKRQCAMVMAYSSVGKTTIALNMIANNPSVPTLFCSIEMSWEMVVSRLASITTGTPVEELEELIKNGRTPTQMIDTANKFQVLVGEDGSEQTIKDIRKAVDEAGDRLRQPIRLVVIDYLELIGGAGMLGKAEQVDKAARQIRAIGKDKDCSVVILHQVSMSNGEGGYDPLDLGAGRYGGHQPMDAVVTAYAPRLNKKLARHERDAVAEELWLQLPKNRITGRAHLEGVRHRLDKHTGKLTPWDGFSPSLPGGYQVSFDEAEYEEREDLAWQ